MRKSARTQIPPFFDNDPYSHGMGNTKASCTNKKDAHQPVHPRSLICTCAVCRLHGILYYIL